jgi:hypothetical protein
MHTPHPPLPYESIKEEYSGRGGGLQTIFLQRKARATAADSPTGFYEDNTTACLAFLEYLFAGIQ